MTLFIGLDPGGTGKKWAYLCATTDDSEKLYVGVVRDTGAQPVFAQQAFPYLASPTIASIEEALNRCLRSLARSMGIAVADQTPPLDALGDRFDSIIVSVDAPSGFSVPGNNIRATERAAGGNFNTPNETAFLASAAGWVAAGNVTPLSQRVYWKLVGFTLYRFFSGAATAAGVSAAACAGIRAGLTLNLAPAPGVRILESFPSDIYRHTPAGVFAIAQDLAGRELTNLPKTGLSQITFPAFANVLQRLHGGDTGVWEKLKGPLGDALDAFSSMMLGIWACGGGLRALATPNTSLAQLRAEGAIVLPV